jgi:hypothetical protein
MKRRSRKWVIALSAAALFAAELGAAIVSAPPASAEPLVGGGPGLTVNFANVKSDKGGEVFVPYSVSRMPRVARVVLERRDSPTDPFRAVDSNGKARGELVDPDGGGPDCDYRVRIEGTRGFVLAMVAESN